MLVIRTYFEAEKVLNYNITERIIEGYWYETSKSEFFVNTCMLKMIYSSIQGAIGCSLSGSQQGQLKMKDIL